MAEAMKILKRFIWLNVLLLIGFIAVSSIQGKTGAESLAGLVFFALLIPFILFSLIANLLLLLHYFVTTRRNRK
jgi:uncharacterized membrane protein